MTTLWTNDELERIDAAEELQITTQRRPVTIWVVRHDDGIYVRSVNRRTSSWFRGAQARHAAHIEAGGTQGRRHGSPARARAATLRLVPHG